MCKIRSKVKRSNDVIRTLHANARLRRHLECQPIGGLWTSAQRPFFRFRLQRVQNFKKYMKFMCRLVEIDSMS